jgi:hypothetical protein
MSKIAQPYQERQERQERLLPCEKNNSPPEPWSSSKTQPTETKNYTRNKKRHPDPARRHFSTSELRFLQAAVTKYLGHNRHNQLTQLTLPRTHARMQAWNGMA